MKPTALIDAEAKMQAARAVYVNAKSKAAIRNAADDFEFWSNKAAMLDVMWKKGMLSQGGAA